MLKETIICIVIIVTIYVSNLVTQAYTVRSVEDISENLKNLKEIILNLEEGTMSEQAIEKVNEISR